MPTGHYPRKPLSEETKRRISEAKKGKPIPEWQRQYLSELFKGRKLPAEVGIKGGNARRGIKFSEERKRKLSEAAIRRYSSIEERIKTSERQRGEKASNWKGGVTPINKTIRHSIHFRLWREAVFSRDDWTCQKCGSRGGNLHPHHIKPFATYPELRFAIDNGITLCAVCHGQEHNQKFH